ncbi:FN3 associated domain-containing protein [Chryseobacterium sp. PMSZPI]|uniref:FN3 associated domain-containing protein n=1 Tax=Chryseobacterium sp. PMSZPI TaxID=1033900 RepID=UPI0039A1B5BA
MEKKNDVPTEALEAKVVAPGGVNQDLRVWLKADDGFSPTVWSDRSGSGNNFTQTNAIRQPQVWAADAGHNFNPSVNFMGSSPNDQGSAKFMTVPQGQPYSGNQKDNSFFIILNPKDLTRGRYHDYFGFNGTTTGSNLIQANEPTLSNDADTGALRLYPNAASSFFAILNQTQLPDYSYKMGGSITYGLDGKNQMGPVFSETGWNQTARGAVLGSQEEVSAADIGEVIGFERELSVLEKQRVRSYLSLKYGITLDQSSPQSYIASDGTTKMWDHTAPVAGTYNKNIAGIGKDEGSGLNQKQSNSVNQGVQVVIAAGSLALSNAANTSSLPDMQFLSWGDNGQKKDYSTVITPPAGIKANFRMDTIWKVQRTSSFNQAVTVAIPYNGSSTVYLVRSTDAVFNAQDTWIPMTPVTVGGISYVQVSNIDFSSGGEYFTFVTRATGPGGINQDLRVWLKADDGFSPTVWSDRSGSGNNFTQTNAIRQPQVWAADAGHNFNPSVNFMGSSPNDQGSAKFMTVPQGQPYSGNQKDNSFFIIINPKDLTRGRYHDYFGFNGTTTGSNLIQANEPTLSNDADTGALRLYPNAASSFFAILNQTQLPDYSYKMGGSITYGLDGKNQMGPVFSETGWNQTARGAVLGSQEEVSAADIGEVIGFERELSVLEKQRVRSYLSLKYGITLDQSSPQSYIASDGTTKMWDHTAPVAGTYNKNIAGIGKDEGSGLNQKQSNSVNQGVQVVIAAGSLASSNAANTSSLPDMQFLSWGDNGQKKDYSTVITPPAGIKANFRMDTIWKVQRTSSFNQAVTVAIPYNGSSTVYLVRSTDAVFNAQDTWIPMTPVTVGGISYVQVSNIDFSSGGEYFTFVTRATGPGGINQDLRVWLKADDGFSPTVWSDRSGSGNNFTQTNAIRQPQVWAADAGHNFNPSVNFMGSSPNDQGSAKFMTVPQGQPYSGNQKDNSFFIIINPKDLTRGRYHDYFGFNGTTTGSNLIQANEPTLSNDADTGALRLYPNAASSFFAILNQTQLPDYSYKMGGSITYGLDGKNQMGPVFSETGWNQTARGAVLGSQEEVSAADIGEVIGFERELSVLEKQRVRSYLSLKYGITLDQSSPQSYIASDGTTKMWDHTAPVAGTYNKNIAGIGKDEGSGLNQKQSNSVNQGVQVVIAAGSLASSNAANTSSLPDMQFLSWGDNGQKKDYSTVITPPAGIKANFRMDTIWKVQRTSSFNQAVTVAIPYNGSSTVYLVRSTDAVFNAQDTWIPMTPVTVGGISYVQVSNIDFSSGGEYFTFASIVDPNGKIINIISASNDDGREYVSGGIDLGSSSLQLGGNNDAKINAFRFQKIEIPASAEVKNAYIEFYTYDASPKAEMNIYSEVGNARAYTTTQNNMTNRNYTYNKISWSTDPWVRDIEKQQTPNLKNIIEENRLRGWISGYNMAFEFVGLSNNNGATVRSFEGGEPYRPRLVIEYVNNGNGPFIEGLITDPALMNQIFINELAPQGTAMQKEDWIELYNNHDAPIYVKGGVYLSNKNKTRDLFELKNIFIAPKGYAIIIADGKPEIGNDHANFTLKNTGDSLFLSRLVNGKITEQDKVTYGEIPFDQSYGRYPNGTGTFTTFIKPTYNTANDAGAIKLPLEVSHERGVYPTGFNLVITAPAGATIKYTLDGKFPSETQGMTYTGPINVNKTMVVKIYAYNTTGNTGVVAHTYVLRDNYPNENGWQRKGNITAAEYAQAIGEVPIVSISGNADMNPSWQIASTEYIDNNVYTGRSNFFSNSMARKFGQESVGWPNSGVKAKFNKDAGVKKANYTFFEPYPGDAYPTPTKIQTLELKEGQDGPDRNVFRLGFMRYSEKITMNLQKEMKKYSLDTRYVNFFINGEYRGVKTLRNSFNAKNLEEIFGDDADNYTEINLQDGGFPAGTVSDGSGNPAVWQNIKALAAAKDFQKFKEVVDVDDMIKFQIVFMFIDCEEEAVCIVHNQAPLFMKAKFNINDTDGAFFGALAGSSSEVPLPPYGMDGGGGNYKRKWQLSTSINGPGELFSKFMGSNTNPNTGNLEFKTLVKDAVLKYIGPAGGDFAGADGAPLSVTNVRKKMVDNVNELDRIYKMDAAWRGYNDRVYIEWKTVDHPRILAQVPERVSFSLKKWLEWGMAHSLLAVEVTKNANGTYTMTNPNQNTQVYYTTDGSDPMGNDGVVSGTAIVYTGSEVSLVSASVITARAFISNNWGPKTVR